MTTYFNDSDIPAMLQACGAVPITIGAVTDIGIVDAPEEVFDSGDEPLRSHGNIVIGVTRVVVQTTRFPGVKIDDVIIVDGVTYSIRDRQRQGDGGLTAIYLGAAITVRTLIFGIPPVF